ncbi:hypothetical protein [Amnibacterium sp.]|uniref:hypothetical protein n=1 Tax=Amnibacterium sp. TaxID=1872496 RepID=UPI003F7C8A17
MADDIQLISDGDGVAVIGECSAVERFLASERLDSSKLDQRALSELSLLAIGVAGAAVQAGGAIASQTGRWVQLTEESASLLHSLGPVTNSASGLMIGVVRGDHGQWQKMLEFTQLGSGALNPMVISSAGAALAQMAMMKKLDELSDYLAVIDQKVDDVLRNQKDGALADMIGVDLIVDEAMAIRTEVGRVSEITWSKVQAVGTTVARTQAYALRQLDGLAEKLERITDVDELAKVVPSTEVKSKEWTAVLVHCFRLQEAIAVLELDRVADVAPGDLEQHRIGLKTAQQNRFELITTSTERLLERMNAAAARANKWVLLNPLKSPAIVDSTNRVAARVVELHQLLGIGRDDASMEVRRWRGAVGDLRSRAVEAGSEGVGLGARAGARALGRARSLTNKVAAGIAERTAERPQGQLEE